jgi:hypothetical protein
MVLAHFSTRLDHMIVLRRLDLAFFFSILLVSGLFTLLIRYGFTVKKGQRIEIARARSTGKRQRRDLKMWMVMSRPRI